MPYLDPENPTPNPYENPYQQQYELQYNRAPNQHRIPPEVLKALVQRGLLNEQTAMALMEKRHGWEEAALPSPTGTTTPGPFGMYVAASPFEHAAAGIRRYQGLKSAQEGNPLIEALMRRKAQANEAIINQAYGE